jgi:hypothetical protein
MGFVIPAELKFGVVLANPEPTDAFDHPPSEVSELDKLEVGIDILPGAMRVTPPPNRGERGGKAGALPDIVPDSS